MNDNPSKCSVCGETHDLRKVGDVLLCPHCARKHADEGTYYVWVKPPDEDWYVEAVGHRHGCEAIAAEMRGHSGPNRVEVYEA